MLYHGFFDSKPLYILFRLKWEQDFILCIIPTVGIYKSDIFGELKHILEIPSHNWEYFEDSFSEDMESSH